MELQRLVREDPDSSVAADFRPGFNVAIFEEPAARARFVEDLLAGLGGDPAGVHLEVTHRNGHYLVVFRPPGLAHKVIDADAGEDVTAFFTAPDGRLNMLGGLGLDPAAALRLMRFNAVDVEYAGDTGTDNPRLARQLAAVDQAQLWGTLDELTAAERRLAAATAEIARSAPAGSGAEDGERAQTVQQARALQLAEEAHKKVEEAASAHRSVLRLGFMVAAACAAIAVVLLVFNRSLDDNYWTAKALFILAGVALVLALADRRHLWSVQRQERRMRAALPPPSLQAVQAHSGPLADDDARNAVLLAAADYDLLTTRWRLISGAVPPHWAANNRRAIEWMARRRVITAPYLPPDIAAAEGQLADTARLVVHRLVELRDVGARHERLPLVLDEPFGGLDPNDRVRLLGIVRQLAAEQQVIVVTGDPAVVPWARSLLENVDVNVIDNRQNAAATPQPAAD